MSQILQIALMNAAVATILAVAVAAASRLTRRPGVMHALWILVLLKLLTPPVLEIGVLPSLETVPAATQLQSAQAPENLATTPAGDLVSETGPDARLHVPAVSAGQVVTTGSAFLTFDRLQATGEAIWLFGAAAILILALVRGLRFKRFLSDAAPAPSSLQRAASGLAARMGMAHAPPIRLVSAPISPMLRPRLGSVELLFPAGLVKRLSPSEKDALLAHELAHARHGDHWVRILELLAVCAFWWFPVVWWVRSRLHRAEEERSDAWVAQVMKDRPRAYASALLKTLEYLAGAEKRQPVLATGIGGVRHLEERLTMIMKNRPIQFLPRRWRLLLGAAAVTVLILFPTWSQFSPGEAEEKEDPARVEMEKQFRQSVLALESEAAELERALQLVRARQQELERDFMEYQTRLELDRMQEHATELEQTGEWAAADRLQAEMAQVQRERGLDAQRYYLEAQVLQRTAELQAELKSTQIEMEKLATLGETDRMAELAERAQDLETALARTTQEARRRRESLNKDRVLAEIDAVRELRDRLVEEGKSLEARGVDHEIARLHYELELAKIRQSMNDISRNREQLEEMMAEAELLEARGQQNEAEQLRDRIREMEQDTVR